MSSELLRILIIDDDSSSRKLAGLSMIVSGLDYQLTFAANLTEAQIAIGQIADTPETAPHVICLDANLSPGNHDGKDGRDLLDMIRKADYKGTVLSISLDPITETGLNIPRDCDIGKSWLRRTSGSPRTIKHFEHIRYR